MTGVYFLSFSLEKEKERKYQRKEKKPVIFVSLLSYEAALLVRARRKVWRARIMRFLHSPLF